MLKGPELKEIEGLISVGKERGYVTYEEMSNLLPTHLVSADQLDDVMILFNKMDIEVINKVKAARKKNSGPADAAPEKKTAAVRSSDPVRVYLRKMGTVPLLSREGEIEIAKRIEDGENIVDGAVLTSPITLRILHRLIDAEEERCEKAIRGGKRPRRAKSSEGKSLTEVFEDVKVLVADRQKVLKELGRAKSKKRQREYQEQLDEASSMIIQKVRTVEIPNAVMAQMCREIQVAWDHLARCEHAISLVAMEANVEVRDLRRMIRKVRRTPDRGGAEVVWGGSNPGFKATPGPPHGLNPGLRPPQDHPMSQTQI